MLILAIDTATFTESIAIYEDKKILATGFLKSKITHSERLLPFIDNFLKGLNLTIKDIKLIIVIVGPGSFTGIKIGVATAKTFSQILNIPIIPINTLESLAQSLKIVQNLNPNSTQDLICPILDAKKKEVYAGVYNLTAEKTKEILKIQAISPMNLVKILKKYQTKIWFAGDGLELYKEYFTQELTNYFAEIPAIIWLNRANLSVSLAFEYYQQGEFFQKDNLNLIEPLYIRLADAEINWNKKNAN